MALFDVHDEDHPSARLTDNNAEDVIVYILERFHTAVSSLEKGGYDSRNRTDSEKRREKLLVYVEAANLIHEISREYGVKTPLRCPEVEKHPKADNFIMEAGEYIDAIEMLIMAKKAKGTVKSQFNYEFQQDDLDKIQQLINQLREKISSSDDIEETHIGVRENHAFINACTFANDGGRC